MIREHEGAYPVRRMCRWVEVTASGYYAWRRRPESARDRENRRLLVGVRALHEESRQSFGSPQVRRALRAAGWRVGRHRIARLMRANGLVGQRPKRFRVTTQAGGSVPAAPDRLQREFTAPEPNRVWVSDITYVRTWQGWLYLACVLDLYSRRIVGWAAHSRITAELVVAAFRMAAVRRRPRRGLILHSDQGKQYRSKDMAKALRSVGAVASMGSVADCYDNAAMERFFGSLKSEWLGERRYETRQEAARDIGAYVDGFYDSRRPHSTLAGLTPAAFEAKARESQLGVYKCGA